MRSLEEELMRYARENLSDQRFGHVERVVETIDRIALAHGLSCEDCRTVGWLHDSAKQRPKEEFPRLVDEGRIEIDEETLRVPKLWHGYHAAYIGQSEFGIDRHELLDAVRFHPTGAPGLGGVGLALFVADYAEPGRPMEHTEEIRQEATRSLVPAALRVVNEKLAYLSRKGRIPHSRSLAFRDWLESRPEVRESARAKAAQRLPRGVRD